MLTTRTRRTSWSRSPLGADPSECRAESPFHFKTVGNRVPPAVDDSEIARNSAPLTVVAPRIHGLGAATPAAG